MAWKKEKEKIDAVKDKGTVPVTIPMERSAEDAKGGPLTADVHPDEVANWEKANWKRAK